MLRFSILKVTECFDFQKSPVWREIQNCHRADLPYLICPHISRSRLDILKNLNGIFNVSFVVGDTFL